MAWAPVKPDGTKHPKYTRVDGQQRFNVAASRAKDQMWLFHSVHTADLHPGVLPNPLHQSLPKSTILDIEPYTDPVDRNIEQAPFRSLLEQRVFEISGIRVMAEVSPPGCRLKSTLLLLARVRRLAVECDGHAFHNEDTKVDDDFREEQLRRVGWEFQIFDWRYYADLKKSLEPFFWEMLKSGNSPNRPPRIYPESPEPEPALDDDTEPIAEIKPIEDSGENIDD